MIDKCNDLLTISEFADILRCCRNTCYAWIKSGKIQSIRIGKEHRIARNELMKFLASNVQHGNK